MPIISYLWLVKNFVMKLFPPRCLGCRSLNVGLCSQCVLVWKESSFQTSINATSVFSSVPYTSVATNILIAAKEDGIEEADDLLVEMLRYSLFRAVAALETHPILVPIPSTSRAVRRRGRNFLVEIAGRVGKLEYFPVRNLLRHNRIVQDQSMLNARARCGNLSGALSVMSLLGKGADVLLIDDLVTTGATLNEAERVLTIAGFTVRGAITACVALPLR
jgi:predicted amidophosphoribosyltransferase